MFSRRSPSVLSLAAALLATVALASCGTVDRIRGKTEGASDDASAAKLKPEDPLARPTQVGWTSARANYCGFIFDPVKLRSDYLATEASLGASAEQMKAIVRAYDYTVESVSTAIREDPNYCDKSRNDAIRSALNRYLSGDYTPAARAAR